MDQLMFSGKMQWIYVYIGTVARKHKPNIFSQITMNLLIFGVHFQEYYTINYTLF